MRRFSKLLPLVLAVLVWAPGAGAQGFAGGLRKAARVLKTHTAVETAAGLEAVRIARRQLGTPYRWGGSAPGGFDCSGLVRFVYSRVGVSLPRVASDQYRVGQRIAPGALRPGDLLFFSGLGHVGLYIGDGRFIDANHRGGSVGIRSLGSRSGSFIGARRVI